MEDLSLHILDLAENAARAGATEVEIEVEERDEDGTLELRIRDNGPGMDEETLKRASDPFFTTREGSRVGLGLPLLRQAAEETNGLFRIVSRKGEGTEVTATFECGHPDMRPLGDMTGTLGALVTGYPGVRFVFDCKLGEEREHFDSRANG